MAFSVSCGTRLAPRNSIASIACPLELAIGWPGTGGTTSCGRCGCGVTGCGVAGCCAGGVVCCCPAGTVSNGFVGRCGVCCCCGGVCCCCWGGVAGGCC